MTLLCEWIIYFRSSWPLYFIANTTENLSTVTVTVISTTSYEGFSPVITMKTTNTECHSSTSKQIVTVSSISLVVLVITVIVIIILVLVVIRQHKKIQLQRYICH